MRHKIGRSKAKVVNDEILTPARSKKLKKMLTDVNPFQVFRRINCPGDNVWDIMQ